MLFWISDAHSGGYAKGLPATHVEASPLGTAGWLCTRPGWLVDADHRDQAAGWFLRTFGRDVDARSCGCCSPDFTVVDLDASLDELHEPDEDGYFLAYTPALPIDARA